MQGCFGLVSNKLDHLHRNRFPFELAGRREFVDQFSLPGDQVLICRDNLFPLAILGISRVGYNGSLQQQRHDVVPFLVMSFSICS